MKSFQVLSDELISSICLVQIPFLPKLFIRTYWATVTAIKIKMVDHLLLAGTPIVTNEIIFHIQDKL